MDKENSSISSNPTPIDFRDIASNFAGKEASVDTIGNLAERMRALDSKLRSSTGEVIVLKYHTREFAAVVVARTNGAGLEMYEDPDTHTKGIKFGAGAAMHRSVFAGNREELLAEESVTIPEEVVSDVFNQPSASRDLMVGDQESKQNLGEVGAMQVGEICFLLEEIGIDVDAFLRECYEPEEITYLGRTHQLGTENGRERAIAEIKKAMNAYKRAFGKEELETQEVDSAIRVRSITVDAEHKILIGDEALQMIYAQLENPDVSLEDVERILRNHFNRNESMSYLDWTGSSVLRGVSINGLEINGTQDGDVTDTKGERVGSYMRLNPIGTDDQSMIIFWDKENGENTPR